ncbi:MAG: cupin domain-containing protein, partial [Clostridiales bacterium]|nr:cupin domain-containing protein [Clostridiales bacterium]
RVHRVRTGESFCMHPGDTHHIANPGKRPAKFLWISSPPSF